MHFALMTHGTRGDVQPLVALAAELQRRGHTTVIASPTNTTEFVRRAGLPAVPLPGDSQAFLTSPQALRCLRTGDVGAFLAMTRAGLAAQNRAIGRRLAAAAKGADAIVAGATAEDPATVIAEAYRVPLVLHHICPLRPTAAVPSYTAADASTPEENQLSHVEYERAGWRVWREHVNWLRGHLGLAPTEESTPQQARALGAVELQAYSPNLVRGLRWPQWRPVVGWMDLHRAEREALGEAGLDAALADWIAAGSAPVYVGFGSMPVADPAATLAMIERVMAALDLRAVVNAGWAGLPATAVADPTRVRVVSRVDHTDLLPRCRAAVHHGGSGTTAQSVRAGLPTLVCSVLLDQLLWGRLVERAGIGAHVRFPALTEPTLRAGLERILQPEVVARAAALGEAVRAEPDPVVVAADLTIAHAARSANAAAKE